ncbi:MAG: hypothetical protein Ta2A_06580 [Treponemataceae bacterium]|nr:MAG: hypothetical protein Ta2A_06580 [Treponemataceae bacterium]
MGQSIIEKVIDGKHRYFFVDDVTAQIKEVHIDENVDVPKEVYQAILADAFRIIKEKSAR